MLRHVEAPARDWIKGLRARMGVTQVELAARLGVHPITVAHWESGATRLGPRSRVKLNDLARLYSYPPIAPRRKTKKPVVVLNLPEGWVEKADRGKSHYDRREED